VALSIRFYLLLGMDVVYLAYGAQSIFIKQMEKNLDEYTVYIYTGLIEYTVGDIFIDNINKNKFYLKKKHKTKFAIHQIFCFFKKKTL
jgi:hypothetical protein